MSSPEPQPALATTKRKFHRLLDNLTASTSTASLASTLHEPRNPSTTSLVDPSLPEPPSKRSRVSDVSMDKPRNVSGSERIRAIQEKLFQSRKASTDRRSGAGIREVASHPTPAKLSTPRKEPNFQPFSQEQFLGRLKTYADVKKWTSKPDMISEVEWAKRGWVCDTWNTVACKGGCEQRVVVKLYPKRMDGEGKEIDMTEDTKVDVDEGLVEKYRDLIIDGHYEDCLWRKRGCSDDIYHIPIPNRAKSSADLLERYHSFKAISDELPLLENITYPEPPIADVLKRISLSFWSPSGSDIQPKPPTSPTEVTSFLLALFGWTGVSESKIALAKCGHCFQRIGFWLYKDERLKEMSNKLELPLEKLRLDILESHREHCPWKNPESQRNPIDGPIRDMAAWQTLEFLLMGRKKPEEHEHQHQHKRHESVLSADLESYRDSLDSDRATATTPDKSKDADSLNEKWRKFKAKLRRTTSRRSLKSVMSTKSNKSVKSLSGRDKENTPIPSTPTRGG